MDDSKKPNQKGSQGERRKRRQKFPKKGIVGKSIPSPVSDKRAAADEKGN